MSQNGHRQRVAGFQRGPFSGINQGSNLRRFELFKGFQGFSNRTPRFRRDQYTHR